MRLKGQLMRFVVGGGLAIMTAGISEAGGGCWCGGPNPPKVTTAAAPAKAAPSGGFFSEAWALLLAIL